AMAGNTAGQGTGAANRLVVGVGGYGGETAMSIGYSRTISNQVAVNLGFSTTSSGDSMCGGSVGFAWLTAGPEGGRRNPVAHARAPLRLRAGRRRVLPVRVPTRRGGHRASQSRRGSAKSGP